MSPSLCRAIGQVQPVMLRGGNPPQRNRGPRLRLVAQSRRSEIRENREALRSFGEGRSKAPGRVVRDRRPLRQDRGADGDGAKCESAIHRRQESIGRIASGAIRTTRHPAHCGRDRLTLVLRHRHRREGDSLPREPDAEGSEQDHGTQARKQAFAHVRRTNTADSRIQPIAMPRNPLTFA